MFDTTYSVENEHSFEDHWQINIDNQSSSRTLSVCLSKRLEVEFLENWVYERSARECG
jgi:hypothetical protein